MTATTPTQDKIRLSKDQLEAFIRFTNQYWFPELTDQMQGKEIFRLQQQGLNLQGHYERIKEKISRTDEYLHAQREARNSDLSTKLTRWGGAFALGALYLAALPVITGTDPGKMSSWQWGISGAITIVLLVLLVWWFRRKS